jgi:hypothetical protein
LRPVVKKMYQLCPKVSASRVSVAFRFVNPKHEELRPAFIKELHQLYRKIWAYKLSNNCKVLTQFYCTLLYTQLYAHIELLNDIDNTVVIPCYGLMLKPYFKKFFRGRRQAHYVPNMEHFKLLL